MIIKVTVDKVTVIDDVEVHEGEHKVNKCVFQFSEEYTNDLVKKAVFIGEDKTPYTKVIANNECDIPAELLVKSQLVLVGVYAYKVNNDDLVLRYSPTPTQKFITTGSYKEDEVPSEEITPSQFEQYMQAMQDEINSAKQEVINATPTVTVGTTTTGVEGSNANVENVGTLKDLVLNFTIPRGNTGEKGDQGNGLEFIWNDTSLGVRVKGESEYIYVDLQGVQGPKGDTGEPFTIKKTYSSVADMNADFNNMELGDYVMIASTVEVEDNAKLYTRGEEQWIFITDFSGATGIRGETGLTPNIQIGSVTSGATPSVTRSGTDENPVLNFVLEKGEKGDKGNTGDTGATGNGIANIQKTSTNGLVDTYTITYTNGNTTTFNVTNGKGISNIAKVSTVDLVDTYRVTFNDNTTFEYTVTNGQDGEVTQEQLDEVQEEVDVLNKVIDQFPRVESTGESVTLNDTLEGRLKIGIGANTEQNTYTGKNLYDGEMEQGTINDNGNNQNSNYYFRTKNYLMINENTTYTISNIPHISSWTFYVAWYDSNRNLISRNTYNFDTNNSLTITSPINAHYIRFAGAMVDGTFNANDYLNTQLEIGSTATSYEPYVGGTASPNPDYPQDIKVVTGNNTVKIQNKNLYKNGLEFTPENLGWIDQLGNYTTTYSQMINNTNYYDLKANQSYVFKINNYINVGKCQFAYDYNGSINVLLNIPIDTASHVITPTQDTRVWVRYELVSANIPTKIEAQLELGSTATEYVEHQEQNLPLNLGNIELCKLGDYQDYIYKNNGSWYIHKEVEKIILDGNIEVFENSNWNKPNTMIFMPRINTINYVVSDKFVTDIESYAHDYEGIGIVWSKRIAIRILRSRLTEESIEGFKTWLSNNNVIIYCQTEEPTTTEITDTTLISQLNAIEKAMSYYEQTNISSTHEEGNAPIIITASALKDIFKEYDSLEARVEALENA